MKKNQIQFALIFFYSTVFVCLISSQAFAQGSSSQSTQASAFLDKAFLQNILITVLSGVLAFLSGYALAGITKRSGSGKRLSYNLDIEAGLVDVDHNIQKKVKVFCEGQEVINLSNIKVDIENTGNSVIKSEEIRFEFSQETQILDFYFEPLPEPEMKVEKLTDPAIREFERKCRIGHIEKDQKLGVRFTVASASEIQLKLHPYNEYGDVEFISQSATKQLSEREQVARFLSLSIIYFLISPIFSVPLFGLFGETITGVVQLSLVLMIIRHIVPFSEVIAELVAKSLNTRTEQKFSTNLNFEDVTLTDSTISIEPVNNVDN